MATSASTRYFSNWTFLYHIGSCPKCMRESFLLMLWSYLALGVGIAADRFYERHLVFFATLAIVAAFTGLFVLHILVFGIRTGTKATAKLGSLGAKATAELVSIADAPVITRRAMVTKFAQAAGIGALTAAATIAAPQLAKANYLCGNGNSGGYCTDDQICCSNGNNSRYWCCPGDSTCGSASGCY